VLDSNPGLLTKDKSDVALVMEKLGEIRLPLQSRDDMATELQVSGLSCNISHVSFVATLRCAGAFHTRAAMQEPPQLRYRAWASARGCGCGSAAT
jgi:hypothetical protein